MSLDYFLAAASNGAIGDIALFGVPFDGTASYRAGARFGPGAIREGSQSIESYSPFLDGDLQMLDFVDWGDLEVAPGSADKMVAQVDSRVNKALSEQMNPAVLGGEHTVTIGALKAMFKKYPDLLVLQLDAHADYMDEYMGEQLSHATVMRRVADFIPLDRIYRFGIRSGTHDELIGSGLDLPLGFEGGMRDIEKLFTTIPSETPLYLTVDLDVFDPSLMPAVGNPEPNGVTYREFLQLTRGLVFKNLVGFDVVELAPQYDSAGVSSIVAASVVRELLICMSR